MLGLYSTYPTHARHYTVISTNPSIETDVDLVCSIAIDVVFKKGVSDCFEILMDGIMAVVCSVSSGG